MARLPYPPWQDKHFAAAGLPTLNVLKLLSYSSETINEWSEIGKAQFSKFAISKKQRELVILLSSAKFGSTYEWTHHIPLSAKFGITDEQRDEILKAGQAQAYFCDSYWAKNPKIFDEGERLLLVFLEKVIDHGKVDEATWNQAIQLWGPRQIVEILSLQGYYYTFSRVTTVLQVDMDQPIKSKL